MARPFTPEQHGENLRFLEALGETGNSRLAARSIGRAHSTMHTRRRASAVFAQNWDAAVAAAHARFHLAGGKRGPEGKGRRGREEAGGAPLHPLASLRAGSARDERGRKRTDASLRTRGGEAVVVRSRSGKLQLRLAQKGKLTKAAEQVFLLALAASANVRLSAAAAGASARAFYRRERSDPVFAREMQLALSIGYERLECAMLEAASPGVGGYDAWQGNALPRVPRISASEALQLLYLHNKAVRQN